jgi:hypothetical protein
MPTLPLQPGSRQGSLATIIWSSGWRVLQMRGRRLDVFIGVTYFAIGFSPITALAIAIFGVLALPVSTLLFVLPSTVLGIGVALRFPCAGYFAHLFAK